MLPDLHSVINAVLPYAPVVIGGGMAWFGIKNALFPELKNKGWLTPAGVVKEGLTGGTIPLGTIGTFMKETVTAPKESFLLAIGPTGSGKTKNLIESIIFSDTENSQVIFDYKGDLFKATAHARSQVGPVYLLDPSGGATNHYNPYVDIPVGDVATIRDFHSWLIPQGGHEFYSPMASALFFAAGAHVLHTPGFEKTMPAVHDFLSRENWAEELQKSTVPEARNVVGSMDKNTRAAITGSKQNYLGWLDYAGVRDVMSKSDFRLTDLQSAEKPFTIYIRLPEQSRKTMMPFARAVIGMLAITLMKSETEAVDGSRKVRGVTFIIDEAKQLALPNIETFLAAGRSFGGRVVIASQLLSELQDMYGDTIEGNCKTQVFFRLQLLKDAEHVSRSFGTRKVIKRHVTQSYSHHGHTKSVRLEEKEQPLLTPTDIMQLPNHKRVVANIDGRAVKLRTIYAPDRFKTVRGKPFNVAACEAVPNAWDAASEPVQESLSLSKSSAAKQASSSRTARRPKLVNAKVAR